LTPFRSVKEIEPGPPPEEIKGPQLVQDFGDFAQKAQGADLFIVLLKGHIELKEFNGDIWQARRLFNLC
jgi:hypothetical protein